MHKIVPENKDKNRECSFNERNELSMCWPLEMAVEMPYGRGTRRQGLKHVTLTNRTTHQFSRHAINCISGEMQKQGVQLTFCPFCAQSLQPHLDLTVSYTFTNEDEEAA